MTNGGKYCQRLEEIVTLSAEIQSDSQLYQSMNQLGRDYILFTEQLFILS